MIELGVLNPIDLVLIFFGGINLILGFFVWLRGGTKPVNIAYSVMSVGVFVWVTSIVLFNRFVFSSSVTMWFAIIGYIGALLIPISSLFFASYFKTDKYVNHTVLYTLSFLYVVLALITLIPGFVISGVSRSGGISIIEYGPLHVVYGIYMILTFSITFFYLWKHYIGSSGRNRDQLRYFLIGTIITASVPVVTNIILPYFGEFRAFMIGPSAIVVMTVFIGYAIIKYGLWDFRKIMVEILITTLVVLSVSNVIIPDMYFTAMSIVIFRTVVVTITILVAFVLMNSFKKEQQQQKKLKKLNKRLVELDKKKTEFLHIATHQLRGPVTVINGYTAMLRDGDYGEVRMSMHQPLDKVLSASKVMIDTINGYMNIARIEEHKLKVEQEDLDLYELVQERVDEFAGTARAKGIKFTFKQSGCGKCVARVDRKNMVQVVNALIENAIKYTSKGSVSIKLIHKKGENTAVMQVKDSGIGIPKGEISNIFVKFSRASNAKSANIFGTGMGLFIVKSLMEANGGSIAVSSKGDGKGTTFTIELPLVAG